MSTKYHPNTSLRMDLGMLLVWRQKTTYLQLSAACCQVHGLYELHRSLLGVRGLAGLLYGLMIKHDAETRG